MEVQRWFQDVGDLPERSPNAIVGAMKGSAILAIAAEIQERRAAGYPVANFTIGDFDPSIFPIPDAFRDGIAEAYAAGQTNYPPAIGTSELRSAIRSFYASRLGIDYPEGSVIVGAGARPPIYAAFRSILEPGDLVVYPVPTWNVRYYVQMNQAREAVVQAKAENGFMPTVDELLPHLSEARILLLNSPLNPAGTVIGDEALRDITQAVVDENRRRSSTGERPLFIVFDQVYWQLTFDRPHKSPVNLVPESARYVIHVDAISKCWAATGIRLGWAVVPPWIRDRMKPLIGHMGAWAPRPEQIAAARLLNAPERLDPWMDAFRGRLQGLLGQMADGLRAMGDEGLPVSCLDAEGALYLSAHFDLIGRTGIDTDEALRAFLLREAGLGVVPFTAFGLPDGTGWLRVSVGTATPDAISGALDRLRDALKKV